MILGEEAPATLWLGSTLCSVVDKTALSIYNALHSERAGPMRNPLLSYAPAQTEPLARQYYSTHKFDIPCLLDALNYIFKKCSNTWVSFQCLKGGEKDLCYCHLIKLQQCLIRKEHPIRQILECSSRYERPLTELAYESTLSKS